MYEASVQRNPEPTPPSRPRQATMLAVLLLIFGGLGIVVALLLTSIVDDSADHGRSVPAVLYVLVYAQLLLSTTMSAAGAFVWQGRSWARVLGIVLCSVNVAFAFASLFTGAVLQGLMGIAINVALLRLLNDYEVRVWCIR